MFQRRCLGEFAAWHPVRVVGEFCLGGVGGGDHDHGVLLRPFRPRAPARGAPSAAPQAEEASSLPQPGPSPEPAPPLFQAQAQEREGTARCLRTRQQVSKDDELEYVPAKRGNMMECVCVLTGPEVDPGHLGATDRAPDTGTGGGDPTTVQICKLYFVYCK